MVRVNNVLIVGQSEILRLKVRSIISSPEINVLEASHVDKVKSDSVAKEYELSDLDLVILDIQFGDEEDLSLLNYLKKRGLDLPVVILSSNDRRETVLRAYRLGAEDYLLKPFEENVLKSKVEYYLSDKQELELPEFENNIIEYFKFDLLEELSRAIRGDLNFSILRLRVDKVASSTITKNLLLSLMRGIDRIYNISETEFLILLPLTDKEGSQVLFERITDYLAEHLAEAEIELDTLVAFPLDIEGEVSENKLVTYQNQIISKLFEL